MSLGVIGRGGYHRSTGVARRADPPSPGGSRRQAVQWGRVDRREERRRGMARVVGLHEDDGSFDREFWRLVPPAERLELVWSMALEAEEWRGARGRQQGLQRSVCRIERRRG